MDPEWTFIFQVHQSDRSKILFSILETEDGPYFDIRRTTLSRRTHEFVMVRGGLRFPLKLLEQFSQGIDALLKHQSQAKGSNFDPE